MKTFNIFLFLLIPAILISCQPDKVTPSDRFFVRTDGADLAVQVDGNIVSNTFVLLLHGGPGGTGYEYNTGKYAELLEKEIAMVYLDQRGHGASQGNYSKSDVTLQQFSDDIQAVVLALKGKYGQGSSVFLAGHSWGGTTGTHALLHTDVASSLKGWIEMNGAHDIPLLNRETVKMFTTIGPEEIAKGNHVSEWQEIVDFANGLDINNISSDEGGRLNQYAGQAEGYLSQINESSGSINLQPLPYPLYTYFSNLVTANAIYSETEKTALTNRLHEITLPTLLLWGKYDFVVPPALGESALRLISSTEKELIIFEHSGHSPMDTEPELFAEAVLDFVGKYK